MKTVQLEISRRDLITCLGAAAGTWVLPAWAAESSGIAPQPYFAAVHRALQALEQLGSPISEADARQIAELARQSDPAAVEAAEHILERYTLVNISVETDGYALTTVGGARPQLQEQGWELYLVRVANAPQEKGKLSATTVVAGAWPLTMTSTGASRAGVPDTLNVSPHIAKNWLVSQLHESVPFTPALTGFTIEYRVSSTAAV